MQAPKDWQSKLLEDVTHKIGDGLHGTPRYVLDSEIYFVNGNNLYDGAVTISSDTKKVSNEEFDKHKKDLIETTLLLSINGTVGNVAKYNGERIILGKSAAYLNCNEKIVLRDYVYYYLHLPETVSHFNKEVTGSTIKNLSLKTIRETPIYFPQLPEQKKIATILSTWDKAIDAQTKLITAKEKQKKAVMQKLLSGEVRFKGFEDEWEQKLIKDLGRVVSGGTPDTTNKEYWDGDISWCTPTDITKLDGKIYIDSTQRNITKSGLDNSSATLLPANSLVVCTRATIGFCAVNRNTITTNQGFKSIIPKDTDVLFLYYLINSITQELISLANGSTFLEISKTDFENIEVHIPALAEQQRISSVLYAADTEIQKLKKELDRIRLQKKGLMQNLLTGKIRVQVD